MNRRICMVLCALLISIVLPTSTWAARNVIILVADGLGFSTLALHRAVRRAVGGELSNLEKLMVTAPFGVLETHALGYHTTDSAAAATAMFCGVKTHPGVLGLDARGMPVRSILEDAADSGRATGIIATHRITDATPAGLVAKVPSRRQQSAIAEAILRKEVDVVLGGGARFFIPQGTTVSDRFSRFHLWAPWMDRSAREDNRDLIDDARRLGYAIASNRRELERLSESPRILGLFHANDMVLQIDAPDYAPEQPTLTDMTRVALDSLSRAPDGFFLMVEGAAIDSASHLNDAGATIREMLDFDAAVGLCLEAARRLGDTLVIVTSDHETGNPSLSYKRLRRPPQTRELAGGYVFEERHDYIPTRAPAALMEQRRSFYALLHEADGCSEKLVDGVVRYTPWTIDEKTATRIVKASPPPRGDWDTIPTESEGTMIVDEFRANPNHLRCGLLGQAMSFHTGVVWPTGNHASGPVPIYAVGPGAGAVRGFHDNTWLAAFVRQAMKR